jgi:hypothetical protein
MMIASEKQQLEDEYSLKIHEFDSREELLNNYRLQLTKRTDELASFVYSFCRDLPEGISVNEATGNVGLKLQQNVDKFADEVRKQEILLEEERREAQRIFNSKIVE